MKKEWCSALVECSICTHQWVAVYHIKCERLECPHCANMVDFEVVKTIEK
jgi:hypothetical protein